jgi:hypothetical protein
VAAAEVAEYIKALQMLNGVHHILPLVYHSAEDLVKETIIPALLMDLKIQAAEAAELTIAQTALQVAEVLES